MKKLFLTAALTTALGLVALTASAAGDSFAGTWTLDKAKSQGLSKRLEGADKVTWTIAQDAKTISVDQKVEGGPGFGSPPGGGMGMGGGPGGGSPPAGAPPGGGMGMGGGGMGPGMGAGMPPMPPIVYNLDGSETSNTFDDDRGKATMKATRSGNALQLSRQTTFKGQDSETKNAETRKLELSGDGKLLTVTTHSEGSRGTTDSTMVFNKQ